MTTKGAHGSKDVVTVEASSSSPRDPDETGFTTILEALVARIPGARGAALVDSLGETVDYAGSGDPFDHRVTAAHLQILVHAVSRLGTLGEPRWIVIRGAKKSFAASVLVDGYILALELRPRAVFPLSTRAVEVFARDLAREAGFAAANAAQAPKQGAWFNVVVEVDARGRPVFVGDRRSAVEVLGAVMDLAVNERGFRVRNAVSGSELTLVREAENVWYADQPVE